MNARLRVLATIAILSLTVLLLQIVLSRLFAGIVYNLLYYFPLSMAMLGLCGGGVFLYVFEERFRGDTEEIARRSIRRAFQASLLFAVLTLGIDQISRHTIDAWLVAAASSDAGPAIEPLFLRSRIPLVLAYGIASVLPFYFLGIAISALLRGYARIVNTVYFCDLAGATAGALLAVPVLNHFASANYVLATPLLTALALAIWEPRGRIYLAAMLALCVVVQVGDRPTLGGHTLRSLSYMPAGVLGNRWTATAYMQMLTEKGGHWRIVQDHHATADGEYFVPGERACAHPLVRRCGLAEWLQVAHALRGTPQELCVLAAGVGKQMVQAWRMGVPSIVGVEMNPALLDFAEELKPDAELGRFMQQDGIHYVIDEARHYVRGTDRVFDLILIPPSGRGRGTAMPISPNHLLTEEAIEDYLSRLSEDGLIVIMKVVSRDVRARVLSLIRGGLERSGLAAESHFVALLPRYMILSKRAFRPDELARAERLDGLKLRSLPELEKGLEIPRRAIVDDYPFSRAALTVGEFASALSWPLRAGREPLRPWSLFALANQLALLLVLVVILFPLVRMPREASRAGARTWSSVAYFFCLGAGFMFVEIPLMEKLVFALGHPIYSISFCLAVLLASTGVGSLLSGRMLWGPTGIRPGRFRVAFGLLIACQLVLYVGVHPLVDATMSRPSGVQIATIGLAIVPLGLLLGMPFPQGIALLRDAGRSSLIPWAWGVNGGASVLAINLSVPLTRIFGITPMFGVALALYVAAFLLLNAALLPAARGGESEVSGPAPAP